MRNREKVACPQGHPYDQANTYVTKAGRRQCRKCNLERWREREAFWRDPDRAV